MEVMVECAPSGRPKKKCVYRITEKGEDLYEYLQTTPTFSSFVVNTAMALPAGVILK
jgi:hypothetical protein